MNCAKFKEIESKNSFNKLSNIESFELVEHTKECDSCKNFFEFYKDLNPSAIKEVEDKARLGKVEVEDKARLEKTISEVNSRLDLECEKSSLWKSLLIKITKETSNKKPKTRQDSKSEPSIYDFLFGCGHNPVKAGLVVGVGLLVVVVLSANLVNMNTKKPAKYESYYVSSVNTVYAEQFYLGDGQSFKNN